MRALPRPGMVDAVSVAVLILAAVVLAAVGFLLLAAPPNQSIYVLVGDDAGYYFNVARNVGLGHGYSFDRLHPTNGFNPLYAFMLIGAYRLLPPDLPIEACYRIGVLLSYLAMVAGFIVYLRLLGGWLERNGFAGPTRLLLLAAGAGFYAFFLVPKAYYGMDAGLVLLLGLILADRTLRHGLLAPGAGAALIDGALLGLLFLARVDTLPLIGAAFGLMAAAALRGAGFGRLLGRLAVCAAVIAPFLVWSTREFGTWMPVSARLKSTFPDADPARALEAIRHTSLHPADQAAFLLAFVVATIASGVLLARAARTRELPVTGRAGAFALLSFYLFGRFTYMVLFSRLDVQGSYAILAHVYLVLAWILATEAAARRAGAAAASRVGAVAAALLLVVSAGLLLGKARVMASWTDGRGPADETGLAAAIRDATRPTDVIYGSAFGLLGFFADRAWINGDGVANSYDYQRALAAGELERFLRENGVTHVVHEAPHGPGWAEAPEGVTTLTVRSGFTGRVNAYEAEAPPILCRYTPRGGGMDVCLSRFRPAL